MVSHREHARARAPRLPGAPHSSWRWHPLLRGAVRMCLHAGKADQGRLGAAVRTRVCVQARTSGVHVCACPRVRMQCGAGLQGELTNASVRTSEMDVCAQVRILGVGTGVRVRTRK